MKKVLQFTLCLTMVGLLTYRSLAINETKTVGSSGADYVNLKAAFNAINAGTLTGNITLQIIGSTTEPSSGLTASLNASGSGSASYTSVLIYPTVDGCTINCANAWSAIIFNGADNVTIDGRVNQTGQASLTIINTVRQAIAFNNGACTNVVKYCTLKGSYNGAGTAGVIIFDNTGGGNSNNIVEYNNITNGGTRMSEMLRSAGAAANINSGNIIRFNNIYDILSSSNNSKEVIYIGDYNAAWTIQGNSIYETSSLTSVGNGTYDLIYLGVNNAGGLFTISENYLGGSAPQCGSTPFTKTNTTSNTLRCIYTQCQAGCTISLQGNVIKNISWENSANAYCNIITLGGGCTANIGTFSGNILGDSVGNSSISLTAGTDGVEMNVIYIGTSGQTTISNNVVGSIKTNNTNPANATHLYIINKSSTTGDIVVSNNRFGSTDNSTTNSLWAASSSTSTSQVLYGIVSTSNTSGWTITGNTFASATNSSTASLARMAFIGLNNGGTNTITGNVIRDLTSSSSSIGVTWQMAVSGINLSGSLTGQQTISDNTIFNLVNDNSTFAGYVAGISSSLANPAEVVISGNFIHSLNVTGASSVSGTVMGIDAGGSLLNVYNNLVVLGNTSKSGITGIYDRAGTQPHNYYFNTSYIYGSSGSSSVNSMAFRCSSGTGTKDFRNNIFMNVRSGLSGSYHYAYYFDYANGTLTSDYNDYYVSGTGGRLGSYYYNICTTLAQLQAQTGGDTHSLNLDPAFANASSLVDTSYRLTNDLAGVTGTGITIDYEGISRASTPSMGAFQWLPISTQAVSSVTTNAATGNGTITKSGSYANRGCIVYPYTGTDKIIGDPGVTNSATTGTFSVGPFNANFTGLSPNTRYNARAHTTKSGITYYGNRVDFYTLCNVPSAPVVGNPMAASLDVTVNTNSNPATTLFCIHETGSGQFVQANGKLGASAVWKTANEWGTKRVSGLTLNNTYTFQVKAKNGDGVETAYGPTASGTTSVMPIVRTGVITWQEGNHYDNATVWNVLAFSGDGQKAFASAYYGTTYRYSAGAWTPSDTDPAYASLDNMAISNDGSKALAGGDNTLNIYSSGAWTSSPIPGLASHIWNCIAMAGDGSKMLAAAIGGRMYINTGSSWTETRPAGDANKHWASADMSDDGSVIITAVGYDNVFPPYPGRVYLSTDGGTTWSETRPDGDADKIWKSVSVSHDGNVLFAVYQGSNSVYKSTDGGATWTSENPNPLYGTDINWRKIDASYDGSRVAASDNNGPLYYYSNGTWAKDFAPISCCSGDISLTSDGERMLVSNNSRTYMSFYGDVISNITFTTATATGTIIDIGGPAATQHGFVWSSTVPVPTIALTSKTQEGPITQTGTYQSQVTGLTANTLYYIRAYATNSNGTVYGDVTTFHTGKYMYVDLAKTGGANNGSSWTNAFTQLYSALDVAGEGDQIWVAKGTYKPKPGSSSRDSSFVIPKGVQVYGGFAGNEANLSDRNWETNVTILSGDIGTQGSHTDNVYHVVKFSEANALTILDGFTVTRGYADGGSSLDTDDPGNNGGGIYNDGSGAGKTGNPHISNCIISYNFANYRGGGVYNESNVEESDTKAGEASPVFTNCSFLNNSSQKQGGAVFNEGSTGGTSSPSFANCSFTSNTSESTGGAVNNSSSGNGTSSPTFTSCTFSSNSSTNDGGAVNSDAFDGVTNAPVFTGCIFLNNHSDADGGAIYNYSSGGSTATATILNCTFTTNSSASDGGAIMNEVYDAGGISSPSITNCSFTGNYCSTVDGKGGAILNQGYPGVSNPDIMNCSFTTNSADRGGAICNYGRDESGNDGTSSPRIYNCTFKGNSATGTLGYGGAIFNYGRSGGTSSPEIINSLISGNVAGYGSAVYNNDGTAVFTNCTMSGNNAVNSNGGTFYSKKYSSSSGSVPEPELLNCIIWHNNDVSIINASNGGTPSPLVHYSDIEGSGGSDNWNTAFGTDVGYNLDSVPVFASKIILTGNPSTAGDLRLTAGSPCADAGQDSYISELFDIRGTGFGRFLLKTDHTQTGPVDMGAYEYHEGTDPLSPMPSLITTAVTNVTVSGGDIGGESLADNGSPIIEKGIVWSTSANPDINDNKIINPTAGTGDYTLTINGAGVSTRLFVRAYATNAGGTAYGDEAEFSTLANVPGAPTVELLNPGKLTVTIVANGNPPSTEFAIQETGGLFVQDDGSLGATDVWKTASSWGTQTITGLTGGTEYGFSAIARNGDWIETAFSDTSYATPIDIPSLNWIITGIGSWNEIQPAGDVNGYWNVAVSENGLTVIAADNYDRAYISTDAGATWTETQPNGDMSLRWEMAALSYSGDTILLPCKIKNQYPNIGRLFKSVDKGTSWTAIYPAGFQSYDWIAAGMSFDGQYMLASTSGAGYDDGTYKSSDGGVSWSKLTGVLSSGEYSVGNDLSPTGEFQIIGGNARMYRSADFGGTWNVISPLSPNKNWERPDMSNDAQTIAVSNSTTQKLYRSTDGGSNFEEMQPVGNVLKNWKQVTISGDGNWMLSGVYGGRLYFSKDSGDNWKETKPAGDVDKSWSSLAMSNDGTQIYAGAFSGRLYKALMSVFDTVTDVTASATGNITSTSGADPTVRGTIYYDYTDTDKILGNAGVLFTSGSGNFGTGTYPVDITGLAPGNHYNARAYATNSVGTGYSERTDFWTLPLTPLAPTVDNPSAHTLDVTLATSNNGAGTEYAIYDTVTEKYVQANGSLGSSAVWQTMATWGTKTVTGLSTGATYRFKVKSRNGNGDESPFGPGASGTTIARPFVSTLAVSSSTTIQATGNGRIDSVYSLAVTNRGLILYPYTNTNKVIGDPDVVNRDSTGTFSTGSFTRTFSGLTPASRYNVRAHATNINGTSYGSRVDFWTPARVPTPPFAGNATATSLDVAIHTNGNSSSTLYAIQDSSASSSYLTATGGHSGTAVWQTSTAWDTVTVSGLSTGVTYYFRVKAKNGNNEETAFGIAAAANTCSNPTNGGTIGNAQSVCLTVIPDSLISLAAPSNYGGTLEYQWQSTMVNASTGFTNITGATGAGYHPPALTDTTWFRRLSRVSCKADWTGAVSSNVVKIACYPYPFKISGYVQYNNNPKTPLDGIKVVLRKNSQKVDSAITNAMGYYQFTGLTNANYGITLKSSHPSGQWQTWGGVNNTDALVVLNHINNVTPLAVNPPVIRVTASVKTPHPAIDMNDYNAIRQAAKYTNGYTYFDIPKWVFSGVSAELRIDTFALNCGDVSRSVKGLCAGDVNATYVPTIGYKSAEPALTLENQGNIPVNDEMIFPVNVGTSHAVGALHAMPLQEMSALTLLLDFDPAIIEITRVEMPGNSSVRPWFDVISNDDNPLATLQIGWISMDPVTVGENNPLLLIYTRLKNPAINSPFSFRLNEEPISELADPQGNVISDVRLTMPVADNSPDNPLQDGEFSQVNIWPNPANEMVRIDFNAVAASEARIELYDLAGKMMYSTEKMAAIRGFNRILFDVRNYSSGSYILKIFLDQEITIKKLVINR